MILSYGNHMGVSRHGLEPGGKGQGRPFAGRAVALWRGMGLNVTDLCCERSGRVVLDGLSFAVAPGEALILRGPNGAGKSTPLRALAGLLTPRRGEIRLGGVSQARDADGYAEELAYAGHLDAIKPQLTVAENLDFWGRFMAARGRRGAGAV